MAPKLALLAAGFVLAAGSAGATAERQFTYAKLQLPSLGIVGADEITTCGAACTRARPHLFIESDGRSSREITPPGMLFQLEDVQFLSRDEGWVVDNDCAAGKAFVHRTHDGGRRWQKAPVRSTNCAAGSRLDLSLLDSKHGWILDVYENGNAPYPLGRTLNGGASWRQVGGAPIAGTIAFSSAREGWLGRGDFAQQQQLYVTLNGGRTWRRRVLPPPPGWKGVRLFPDVPTFFGKRAVLPVTLTRSGRAAVAFYLTGDGGRSWAASSVRTISSSVLRRQSPFISYVATAIVSPTKWWAVDAGARPRIAVTVDGGKSWRSSTPAALPKLTAAEISAADAQHAWLTTRVQNRLVAYKTSNAGRSWQRLSLPRR
jgi:photosystem II stability/assembly factor-like uncharacterized protein